MASAERCPECGGTRIWTIVGAISLEQYCRDCYFFCDCGKKRSRKEADQKCPSCGLEPPLKPDTERVAEWIKLIKRGEGHLTQLVENLGRIGPAGRAARPLLEKIFREQGKGDFLGCAAYDALREHKYNDSRPNDSGSGSGCLGVFLLMTVGMAAAIYRFVV